MRMLVKVEPTERSDMQRKAYESQEQSIEQDTKNEAPHRGATISWVSCPNQLISVSGPSPEYAWFQTINYFKILRSMYKVDS